MKKTIKFFAAALAIVAAASCAKENQNISDQELVYKVFSATFDADTKTTLHTDGLTVHWTEGDKIKLLSSTSSSGNDFELLSYDKTFAEFGGETVDANSYRAVYPANALLSEGHINWWATNNQNYVLGSKESKTALAHQFAVENNFSIVKEFNAPSNFALSTSSKDGNLYFQNINAYLKFSLKMDNAAVIEVSAAKAMSSNYTLSEEAKLGDGIYITFNGNKYKKGIIANGENITFKREDGSNLLSGEDICYYIAIPSVKMEGLKLVVKDSNGKVLQTLTKSSTFTAEANKIYNLGTIEAAPIPVPKVGDYFYSDGTFSTNLDTDKTVVGVIFALTDATSTDPNLAKDYPHCINGLVLGSMEQYSNFGDHTKDDYNSGSTYNYFSTNGWPLTPRDDAEQKIMGYTHTLALKGYREFRGGNYANLVTVLNGLRVIDNCSPWYIPSFAEMKLLKENANIINNKMGNIGNVLQTNAYYWPSTLMKGPSYNDHITQPFNMSTGTWKDASDKWDNEKTKSYPVRVIFAF